MSASASILHTTSQRDPLWEHSRNSLGIARLLVHERRPESLVAAACQSAIESACRAALVQAGLRFDGDVERALTELSVPPDLRLPPGVSSPERLAGAERVISWLAAYLRAEAPGRSWGY
jgi:hypothetical protein